MNKLYIAILFSLFLARNYRAQVSYSQNVFAFIGDYGTDDKDEDSVSLLVKSWNPEAIITLGDNNYPIGSAADIDNNVGKYFHDYIKPYSGTYGPGADTNRFWPALGNHDVMTASGAPYFNYFQLPNNERYYDFVNGDIHFFCLDSDFSEPDGNTDPSVQSSWIKNKMLTSSAKWKIVYAHHSPYCSDSLYGDHPHMQWPFRSWGADIVLTAHAHVYERLFVDSLPYIVCGLGGEGRYLFDAVPDPGSITRYNLKYGAVQMQERPDSLCFRFFNVMHELIDSLFLVKPSIGIKENDALLFSKPYIFPNPSNGEFWIDLRKAGIENETIMISIKDILGTNIHDESFRGNATASRKKITMPPGMASGIFVVQIRTKTRIFSEKILLSSSRQ